MKVERKNICFTRDVVICFHQFDKLQIFLFDNVFCLRPVFSAFDNDLIMINFCFKTFVIIFICM